MTGPAGVGDGGDEVLVGTLAAALYHQPLNGIAVVNSDEAHRLARVIAPVVSAYAERQARQVAAAELEAAAEELTRPRTGLRGVADLLSHADMQRATYARWLLRRAAALTREEQP